MTYMGASRLASMALRAGGDKDQFFKRSQAAWH
jgi:hypothetical protein